MRVFICVILEIPFAQVRFTSDTERLDVLGEVFVTWSLSEVLDANLVEVDRLQETFELNFQRRVTTLFEEYVLICQISSAWSVFGKP